MRDKGRSGVTSPAGPNNADATAAVFVADHLAHQNYSGGPLAAKTVPVQRPQYEKLLEVLRERTEEGEYRIPQDRDLQVCTRPKRSASVPENHAPSDEISNVTVPMRRASPRDNPHSAITVGVTKLYICTSNASSAQPPKHSLALFGVRSPNRASIAFLRSAF